MASVWLVTYDPCNYTETNLEGVFSSAEVANGWIEQQKESYKYEAEEHVVDALVQT